MRQQSHERHHFRHSPAPLQSRRRDRQRRHSRALGILLAITGLAVLSAFAALRGDACARTAAQSRPTPSGLNGRLNVCWSRAPTGAAGRVEMWRGGSRVGLSVAAPFGWRCPSNLAIAPFPHPAHRTGHAELPHPALGQDFTPSHTPSYAPARGQTYESVVPVEVLERIGPAPASSDLVLGAQPPA